MSTLATFLMSITGGLVTKALFSLGFGYISYQIIATLTASAITKITANYNLIDSTTLNIINMCGFGQAFGILFAAFTTKASLIAIKKLAITK